jgi:hypothetical protein
MKKIIATLIILVTVTTAFAMPPVTEIVLKQFNSSFPTVENAKWYEGDNYFEVYFEKDQTQYHIQYDQQGKVMSTRNYYAGAKLSPFIKARVSEKYPGKTIFGVTEITNQDEMYYVIALEDAAGWTNVKVNAIGQISVLEKLRKSPK